MIEVSCAGLRNGLGSSSQVPSNSVHSEILFHFKPLHKHFSPCLFSATPLFRGYEMEFSFLGEISRNKTVNRYPEKCRSKTSICKSVPWHIPASQLVSAGVLSELHVVSVCLGVSSCLSSTTVSVFL